MGRPKGLLEYRGGTWLEAQVKVLQSQGIERVVLVLGADAGAYEAVMARLSGVEARLNPDPDRGPFSSLQVGLEGITGSCWVSPLDVPIMDDLNGFSVALSADEDAVVPTFEGRGGHPVLLSEPFIQRLLAVDPASPAARLDHQLRLAKTIRVPVSDPRVVLNLNTPEAWAAFTAQA